MRLSDNIKDCVCFLCGKNQDGSYHFGGTGFFVSVPSENHQGHYHVYIVTAKHNIDDAKKNGFFDLHLRINTVGGRADFIRVKNGWIEHLSEAVDLAVLGFDNPIGSLKVACVPIDMLATDDKIQALGIGIGDELSVVGLFTSRHGDNKNIPIVRSGIISAMPEEPLQDQRSGLMYDAFLGEIRSIGGLSGSPVFVHNYSIDRKTPNLGLTIGTTKIYLLGLIRGHWDLEQFVSSTDFAAKKSEMFNAGVAIITPARHIADILQSDDLRKERKKMDRIKNEKNSPS